MNSGPTRNLEQPSTKSTIQSATISPTTARPEGLLADWRISVLALIALWAVIYMAGLSRPPLLDDVDTIHAEAAREMLLRHDWVTLYTNGFRYLEKAPLIYWSLAASYRIFGIGDWSTRLPLMLGVLALVFATYHLGRYAYGEAGGLYAGVALVTSLGLFIFTRFLIPEVLVALWLTLGYYFFLRSLEEERPSHLACWGFAATCALNVLTKGLIGLVFPAGAIGLYLLLTGNLRRLLKLRLVSSTLVFFAIAAPWHILAALRNPAQGQARGFLWFYFINEHVMRFLNKRVPPGYDTVPLAIFWGLLLAWLLPWSVFLPQTLRDVPAAPSRIAQRAGPRTAGEPSVFSLGVRHRIVLQLFDPAGVLHDPRYTGHGAFDGRLAGPRVRSDGERVGSPRGKNFLDRPICFRCAWVRGRNVPFICFPSARPWGRLGGPAQKKSAGLRFLAGACAGFDAARPGRVSRLALRSIFWAASRRRIELDPAAARPAFGRQCCARRDDDCVARLRAFLVQHILADPFFVQSRGGGPKTVPSRRCDRDRRRVPPGFHAKFLYRGTGTRPARTERKFMVRREISGRAAYFRDPGIAGGVVERPGAGVPVDRPGRPERTARLDIFCIGAQRRKIHL